MEKDTALITGASSGMGRELALHLASKGTRVIACARREGRLNSLAEELKEFASDHRVSVLDVQDRELVSSSVARFIDEFGSIDLLFNGAGINFQGSADISPDDWDAMLATNLTGAWNVLHSVVPHMKARGSGCIINVSSICGVTAFAGVGAYSAGKFGLMALNESLFRELVPLGIRVTALCPSWVATDMAAHAPMPDDEKIQTADICRAVDFVRSLSPHAHLKELVIECRGNLT